jgi:L-aminopeptidase/D-esterase-like protein
VVGGSIFDLDVGDPKIRPDAESAYRACKAASPRPVEEGNVGAGAGATVGKMLHGYGGMKGGLGSTSITLGDIVIGALVVINASGDIVDWRENKIIAGARNPHGKGFANIVETLKKTDYRAQHAAGFVHDPQAESTNLVVVATNVSFDKRALTKIASMASTGAARVINPYHTMGDGDSSFAVSTNILKIDFDISAAGALAADVVSEAVLRAVKMARSIEGWPAWRDYSSG